MYIRRRRIVRDVGYNFENLIRGTLPLVAIKLLTSYIYWRHILDVIYRRHLVTSSIGVICWLSSVGVIYGCHFPVTSSIGIASSTGIIPWRHLITPKNYASECHQWMMPFNGVICWRYLFDVIHLCHLLKSFISMTHFLMSSVMGVISGSHSLTSFICFILWHHFYFLLLF